MRFGSLDGWLLWQERLHPKDIDLGLERVAGVWRRMGALPRHTKVITVGGTNGKGSTVAILQAALLAAGYQVGTFTSPHLIRYNERICLNGAPVSDEVIVNAFDAVDRARDDISLTYFEFSTLAALWIFAEADVQTVLLEVGLGGRLDSVNIIDADVAVIASLGRDHEHWLGDTLEAIGREKAGIFRAGRPAVYGGVTLPDTVAEAAATLGARLECLGRDFHCTVDGDVWRLTGGGFELPPLPLPRLSGDFQVRNAACAVTALQRLGDSVAVPQAALETAMRTVTLPGRLQYVAGSPEWILDVAHNADAAERLARHLKDNAVAGKTVAVIGLLGDKDPESVVRPLGRAVDRWVTLSLEGDRGRTAEALAADIRAITTRPVVAAGEPNAAFETAASLAGNRDRIVVLGSFQSVGPALSWLGQAV